MITVLVAQVSNLRSFRSSGSKLAVVMLVASLIGAAAAAPAVAQQPGAGPLTEVWSLQRGQETPNAPGVPISAGPVAYSPVAGEQPRFFAMVLDQRLTVNDASGKEVWSLQLDDEAQPDPAVADVDRDGRAELVLSLSDAVLCVRDGGQVAWRRSVENVLGSPACADVLGDERLEILAADGDGGLTCLDAGGRVLWHLMAESALRPADQDPFLSRLNWNFERYRNRDATAPVADLAAPQALASRPQPTAVRRGFTPHRFPKQSDPVSKSRGSSASPLFRRQVVFLHQHQKRPGVETHHVVHTQRLDLGST